MLQKLKIILTRQERDRLVLLSVGTLLLSLSEALSIGIIIPIMGLFVNQSKIQHSAFLQQVYRLLHCQSNISFLIILIIAAIILFAVKSVYSVFMLYQQQRIIGDIEIRLKTDVLRSYLNQPYSFHIENNSSLLFKNLTAEIGQFMAGLLIPAISICAEMIILSGVSLLLVIVYPYITLGLIGIIGGIFIPLNLALKEKIKSYSSQRFIYSTDVYKTSLEALNAVKEIQMYNVENFFTERFAKVANKYISSVVKFNFVQGIPRYLLELIVFISILGMFLGSVYYGMDVAEVIPVVIVMGVAAIKIIPSINRIYSNVFGLQYSSNSLDTIYKVLCALSNNKETLNVGADTGIIGDSDRIRLEKITFCHTSSATPLFKDMDLIIPLNRTVAFVGSSGAGKSTLIDILTGLLEPCAGNLYCGKMPVSRNNRIQYRRQIGYVPQEIYLIDDTIEANIAFGIPKDKIERNTIKYVIQIAQLTDLINELPEGIETPVGERGIKLSGGQRQRIGIARALYHNPEILIFDEATSALDGQNEFEITQAIKKMRGSITIILVAHRMSTIEHADIIYLMDQGRIVAQGTYRQLLENEIIFQNIARQGEFAEKERSIT